MTSSNNTSTTSAPFSLHPRSMIDLKRGADSESVHNTSSAKSRNYGKCQYKTGKCFNERTVKRNGDAHSLCEEHRVKQNLIQRRSDRKYQTVHAIRRRERSQRRAVLKKQVSMAVAQQLFYEHQQQKTLGIPLPQHHPLHVLTTNSAATTPGASSLADLAPPIRVPPPSSTFMLNDQSGVSSPLILSFQPQSNCMAGMNASTSKAAATPASIKTKEESTPTGIDSFTSGSFLSSKSLGTYSMPGLKDSEIGESSLSDSYTPIVSCSGDKETWSEDDIEFLQTILLA